MTNKRRAVITGLGLVSPLGCNQKDFWDSLLNGKSGIDYITKFDTSEHKTKIAGEVKDFQSCQWLDKKDFRRLDLFTQYAVVAAGQAIQDSGLDTKNIQDASKHGVVLGAGMGGMTDVESQYKTLLERGPRRVSPYFIPKVMVSAPCGEISIRYGFKGPNFVSSAACASSPAAIGQALRMIQYGDADVMLTGGTEAVITPASVAGFISARALSTRNEEPQKASRPFDKDRDGFVIGEGAGILVLEEYERAKARGAKIYAELCGAAWGADAHHITAPCPEGTGAADVMEKALKNACINKNQVSYINAHGTSTQLNDAMETAAIKRVFADNAYKIPISSTKSMIGHLIGASGALESIACVLSISNHAVHCTANYNEPDPVCDLDYVPNNSRQMKVNYALSNSFAFGGANGCLVFGKV